MTTRRDFLSHLMAAGVTAASSRIVVAATSAEDAQTGTVETVLGPIGASRLGVTLPHEHVADASSDLSKWPKLWGGRPEFVAKAVAKLKRVRAAGISTVVDLSPYDVWRDIRFLQEISRRSGMNMIACTGQRFFPPISPVRMPARTVEGLTEFFTKEIQDGIDGTGIKAGVIKIGVIGKDVTALEEIGLRAATRAGKASGVPIRIHTDAANRAGERIAIVLEDEGMDPARVSFDHSDDSGDMDYFLGLVKRGYSLSMDHVHRGLMPNFRPSWERRLECIRLLIDAGFSARIFLSTDSELGGALIPEESRDWRDKLDPADGMLFTTRKLIPDLQHLGVSDQQIRTITIENPRRFFARNSVFRVAAHSA